MKRVQSSKASGSEATESTDPSPEDWEPETDHDDLIRWMLDLSPAERLAALQDFVDGVMALRDEETANQPKNCTALPVLLRAPEPKESAKDR